MIKLKFSKQKRGPTEGLNLCVCYRNKLWKWFFCQNYEKESFKQYYRNKLKKKINW